MKLARSVASAARSTEAERGKFKSAAAASPDQILIPACPRFRLRIRSHIEELPEGFVLISRKRAFLFEKSACPAHIFAAAEDFCDLFCGAFTQTDAPSYDASTVGRIQNTRSTVACIGAMRFLTECTGLAVWSRRCVPADITALGEISFLGNEIMFNRTL